MRALRLGILAIATGQAACSVLVSQPTPTSLPGPTVTAKPTSTLTQTVSPTPTWTATPSISPTPTITPTPSQTPTVTKTPSPTITLALVASADCIPEDTKREVAQVVEVIDGDTIRVLVGTDSFSVRYIGMDTPELSDTDGYTARSVNAGMVSGKTVVLVKDVSETDRYDRLLRYVVVGGTFVNHELVARGYATVMDYPPDSSCSAEFTLAEADAAIAGLGLWQLEPTRAPTAEGGGGAGGGNCSPYYSVCIPPPPPDLDCGDIPYRRFSVSGGDPHRFDGDHDGIGCES